MAASVFGQADPVEDRAAPPPAPTPIDALQLLGVQAEAITLPGETSTLPAVRFSWDVTTADTAMSAIRAEVRRVGETDAAPTRIDDVAKGQANVTNGVGPDQALECRLVPLGDPSRPVLASNWITVSTSTIIAGDVSPTAPVIVAMQDAIDLAEAGIGSINTAVASLNATIYTAGTGLKARSDAMFASLNTPTTGVLARLTTVETSSSSNNEAAVSRLNALEATVNTAGTGITARLATAESAIISNNSAATSRLAALEATVNTAGTGLSARVAGLQTAVSDLNSGKANAADLTSLQAEVVSARGGASSLNVRLNAVESTLDGKASAATVAALSATVNAPGTGLAARTGALETATSDLQSQKADASRVQFLEARADTRPNQIPNSTGAAGLLTWAGTYGVRPPEVFPEAGEGPTFGLSFDSAVSGQTGGRFQIARFKADPQVAYSFQAELSAYLLTAGAVRAYVTYENAAGGSLDTQSVSALPGGYSRRVSENYFSPAGTVQATVNIDYANATFSAGGYAGWRRLKLERGSVCTVWSDEASDRSTAASVATLTTATADLQGGKADATRVTSLEAIVSTPGTGVTARLTNVESVAASADGRAKAIKGLVLDVNNYISGYSSTNDGTTAAFEVLADTFGIRSPGGGERTEYRAGRWYIYSPTESTRTMYGKAFGGTQKLVWWTGPTSVPEGAETKGNAYVYMSQNTVGGLRFGGSDVPGADTFEADVSPALLTLADPTPPAPGGPFYGSYNMGWFTITPKNAQGSVSYSWTCVQGSNIFSANSPTSATTVITATDAALGQIHEGTFAWTATDSATGKVRRGTVWVVLNLQADS